MIVSFITWALGFRTQCSTKKVGRTDSPRLLEVLFSSYILDSFLLKCGSMTMALAGKGVYLHGGSECRRGLGIRVSWSCPCSFDFGFSPYLGLEVG